MADRPKAGWRGVATTIAKKTRKDPPKLAALRAQKIIAKRVSDRAAALVDVTLGRIDFPATQTHLLDGLDALCGSTEAGDLIQHRDLKQIMRSEAEAAFQVTLESAMRSAVAVGAKEMYATALERFEAERRRVEQTEELQRDPTD